MLVTALQVIKRQGVEKERSVKVTNQEPTFRSYDLICKIFQVDPISLTAKPYA